MHKDIKIFLEDWFGKPFNKLEKEINVFDRCLKSSPYESPPLPEELNEPKIQHAYIRHIPDGYQYCNNCEVLTPHTLNSQINPSKSICTDFTCDICDSASEGYDSCPRCGWDYDPEDILPEVLKDKKHTIACLNKQEAENDADLRADIWDNCDCPEVDVYPISNCYNYKERSVFSMDCSNAKEWSYEVICPKCNYIFEVEDGNC